MIKTRVVILDCIMLCFLIQSTLANMKKVTSRVGFDKLLSIIIDRIARRLMAE